MKKDYWLEFMNSGQHKTYNKYQKRQQSKKMAYMAINQLQFGFSYTPFTYLYVLPSSLQEVTPFMANSFIPISQTQTQENLYPDWNSATLIKMQSSTAQQLPSPPQKPRMSLASNAQIQNGDILLPNQPNINTTFQSKSRNILPNNINLILSFVRRQNKSGHLVSLIIQGLKESSYTVKKFYSYELYLKDHLRNQASMAALSNIAYFCDPACAIFSLKQQRFYNKVCRILIKRFLYSQAVVGLLSSKKMLKTKKIDHLHSYRFISSSLSSQK